MAARTPPSGFHSITPYLIVDDGKAAIAFYEKAFGATETMRLTMGEGIAHAELLIGDSHIMLSEEWPDMDALGPRKRGGTSVSLMLYVPDVDAAFDRAVAAGATVRYPVKDQFYGDRTGTLVDPFGHQWSIGTNLEELSQEEAQRRMEGEYGSG